MENSENKNLSTIREELAALMQKAGELEKRISEIEALPLPEELPVGEPIDIIVEDVPFVVPSRKDELGIGATREARTQETPPANGAPQVPADKAPAAKTQKQPKSKGEAPAKVRAWMVDAPASAVSNILSGIALKDRGIFINSLFKEDPQLFIDTIGKLNAMSNFAGAQSYIEENFPDWNLDSDAVYRLMMAIRRKLN